MTQFQHHVIAWIILRVLWNLFIKQYFYDEAEHQWWMDFWHKIFS